MTRRGKCLVILALLWASLSLYALPGNADALVTVLENNEDYQFGEQITFWARLQAPIPIRQVEVLYRPQTASNTMTGLMTLEKDEVKYQLNLQTNLQFIPVFATIEYRYRVTLDDGQVGYSDYYTFRYLDNRFTWQSLEELPFHVHWIEGDLAFGQSVVDAARNGLQTAQELFELPQMEKIDIFVYTSSADVQSALQLGGFDLAAGHASPELGVMMVSLPVGPAQLSEIRRQIPHELVHLMLYQKLGERSRHIPAWLNEGLASLNEPSPNPDYAVLLEEAVANGTVKSLEVLCGSFSMQGYDFYLSYAEAESFTRFLNDHYGSSRFEELLMWYADGVECTRAPELVYGQSLARLENQWLNWLKGETQNSDWLRPLLPWFTVLAAALLVPLLLAFRPIKRAQPPIEPKRVSRGGVN